MGTQAGKSSLINWKLVGGLLVLLLVPAGCSSNGDSARGKEEIVGTSDPREGKVILAIGEWSPYTGENLPGYGVAAEIVTEALERMDVDYEYRLVPWERALVMTENGDAWGTFPWFYTQERAAKYLYSREPVWRSTTRLFYHRKNPKFVGEVPEGKELEDLKAYDFGGVYGYFYEEIYRTGGYRYYLTNNIEDAMKLLHRHRVDIVMEDDAVGMDTLRRLFPDEVKDFATLPFAYNEENMLMIASPHYPNSQELLDRFDSEIAQMKEDGTYKRILEEHALTMWPE